MPRRAGKRLTDPGIAKLRRAPSGRRVEHPDLLEPGLALRVTDRGGKTWAVRLRVDGRQRRITLGPWGAGNVGGVGVAEARRWTAWLRHEAEAGRDPVLAYQQERQRTRTAARAEQAQTFGRIAKSYIKRHCKGLARGREIEAVIRNRLVLRWGDLPAAELRRADLVALTDDLVDAGHPGAAAKAHEVARQVMRWAARRDAIPANPFAETPPPVRKVARERALSDDELARLWWACAYVGYPFGTLVRLLLLTGLRLREVANARWTEFDSRTAPTVWKIPVERTKSRREHLVPLSRPARYIVSSAPRFTKGDCVFSTTSGRKPVSGFSKAKRRLDRASGVTGWRYHDLRRTCRTGLSRLRVDPVVSERVLGHLPRGIERVYDVHDYIDQKREALEAWGDLVVEIALRQESKTL